MKIYDISTKQRITNVLRDDVSLRPDMYPCSLCWKDNQTLIVGWGKSIKVGPVDTGGGVGGYHVCCRRRAGGDWLNWCFC